MDRTKLLIISILITMILILWSCNCNNCPPNALYCGILADAEYHALAECWILSFDGGRIFKVINEPEMGFKIAKKYAIYQCTTGLEARETKR